MRAAARGLLHGGAPAGQFPSDSVPAVSTFLQRGAMKSHALQCRSRLATALFDLLDPVAFGLFVGALIFDVIYMSLPIVMWVKGAAWLVTLALVFAIVPRLINLAHVWIVSRRTVSAAERLDFWFNLLAIVSGVVNAFVHSRDAFGAMPLGMWLSAITVALLCLGRIVRVTDKAAVGGLRHE
ncbi:Predicted membrane protein [Bordetella ansorpii]|uniref:Predicted membrane protein n=2 Tax=Bordetella ansorpii TaxID=288768 RepID=A0A157S5I4_9BORD|nr:Predicted membrane protein [Bordetella ansorpii]